MLGTSAVGNISEANLLFGFSFKFADFFSTVILLVWLLNMIFVALVPDLVLIIKTNSASEAITIRRKQFATLFKQEMEYTGFSEVLPDKDIDIFVSEIGALIHDIQALGDMGIDKWKN